MAQHWQVQLARGTSAQAAAYTGPPGEITVDTTHWAAAVHDGVTPGGHPLGRAVAPLVSKTANYAIQPADAGVQFNNAGAGGPVTFALPPALGDGQTNSLTILAAHQVTIAANGSDAISSDADSTASLSCATQYAHIEWMSPAAGIWIVTKATGVWG